MAATDDASNYCTSGFGVTQGSIQGILTAAHCPNNLLYNGDLGIISYQAEGGAYQNGVIDLQWHKTLGSNTAGAFFRWTANSDRIVSYGQNADINASVCEYGVKTNSQQCTTVRARNTYYVDGATGRTFTGLTRTNQQTDDFGDSGGPWYSGNIARGIQSGHANASTNPPAGSFYTPYTQFSESLGLTLNNGGGD